MRNFVIGSLAAAGLIAVCSTWIPAVSAQGRDRVEPLELMALLGGGSRIGVSVRDLTAEEITRAKLDQPGGVLVQEVRDGSPAARAGLKTGDIVVQFDGERVRSASHFMRLVRETASGRPIKSSVVRDGARLVVDLTPETNDRRAMLMPPNLPDDFNFNPDNFNFNMPRNIDPVPPLRVSPRGQIGVQLAPLGEQLAGYFGVKGGVLVSSVTSGSAAAQAGLKAGDVITAVNGRAVQNVGDVTAAVREAKPGGTVAMQIVRDRKDITVTVIVPERIDEPRSALPV
jgi:serine protease Do